MGGWADLPCNGVLPVKVSRGPTPALLLNFGSVFCEHPQQLALFLWVLISIG